MPLRGEAQRLRRSPKPLSYDKLRFIVPARFHPMGWPRTANRWQARIHRCWFACDRCEDLARLYPTTPRSPGALDQLTIADFRRGAGPIVPTAPKNRHRCLDPRVSQPNQTARDHPLSSSKKHPEKIPDPWSKARWDASIFPAPKAISLQPLRGESQTPRVSPRPLSYETFGRLEAIS